jgi:hypothetical protein
MGGWVDPRAGLDDVEKRQFLSLPGLEFRPLGLPARSQSLCRLSVSESESVRVRVTLQLTVSQSVYLGVEPNLGLLTRDIFFFLKVTVLSYLGRPL